MPTCRLPVAAAPTVPARSLMVVFSLLLGPPKARPPVTRREVAPRAGVMLPPAGRVRVSFVWTVPMPVKSAARDGVA